jgi:hypothetical protein
MRSRYRTIRSDSDKLDDPVLKADGGFSFLQF